MDAFLDSFLGNFPDKADSAIAKVDEISKKIVPSETPSTNNRSLPNYRMEHLKFEEEGVISSEQLNMDPRIELVWRRYYSEFYDLKYFFAKFVLDGENLRAHIRYEKSRRVVYSHFNKQPRLRS